MKYLIDMPKEWDFRDCMICIHTNAEKGKCGVADFNDCPLFNAKKAVEVINSISRALQSHDGTKIYMVQDQEV